MDDLADSKHEALIIEIRFDNPAIKTGTRQMTELTRGLQN